MAITGPRNSQNQSSSSTKQTQFTTMAATPETMIDTNWYPNSVAMSHCTPHIEKLLNKEFYQGTDQVYIGSGSGLPIQHIGNSIFPSPFTSQNLSLC